MNIALLSHEELKRYSKILKELCKTFPAKLEPVFDAEVTAAKEDFNRSCQEKNLNITFTEVWRSKLYLVQVFNYGGEYERITVCRSAIDTTNHRWRDGITWDELQKIKREVGRGDFDAIEAFPKDSDVVNVANMRHLWVFPDGSPITAFMWRAKLHNSTTCDDLSDDNVSGVATNTPIPDPFTS